MVGWGMRLAFTLSSLGFLIIAAALFFIFYQTKQPIMQATPTNDASKATSTFSLTSPAITEGGLIPSQYTCDGENKNPELQISGVPEWTRSLVLLMEDPDIPNFVKERMGIDVFDHWVLFNIPATTTHLAEGDQAAGGALGKNSSGKNTYTGPCPPDREHRYFWKLFALDVVLELEEGATKAEVEKAMHGHILQQTELLSRYARLQGS